MEFIVETSNVHTNCVTQLWFSIGSTIGSCCWGIIIRTDYLSMINRSPMKTNCAMSPMWKNPSLLESIRLFARRIFVRFHTNLNQKIWFILLILEKWKRVRVRADSLSQLFRSHSLAHSILRFQKMFVWNRIRFQVILLLFHVVKCWVEHFHIIIFLQSL